jgi:hypothetical protein
MQADVVPPVMTSTHMPPSLQTWHTPQPQPSVVASSPPSVVESPPEESSPESPAPLLLLEPLLLPEPLLDPLLLEALSDPLELESSPPDESPPVVESPVLESAVLPPPPPLLLLLQAAGRTGTAQTSRAANRLTPKLDLRMAVLQCRPWRRAPSTP